MQKNRIHYIKCADVTAFGIDTYHNAIRSQFSKVFEYVLSF